MLVVPAFETSDYRLAVPTDKAGFLHAWDAGEVRPFREDVWPAAHRATDFGRWRHASLPYAIDWQQGARGVGSWGAWVRCGAAEA